MVLCFWNFAEGLEKKFEEFGARNIDLAHAFDTKTSEISFL